MMRCNKTSASYALSAAKVTYTRQAVVHFAVNQDTLTSRILKIAGKDSKYAVYRTAAAQRKEALAASDFPSSAEGMIFVSASDFTGAKIGTYVSDEFDDVKTFGAMSAGDFKAAGIKAFFLAESQSRGLPHVLIIRARQGPRTSRCTILINGKSLFDDATPFGTEQSTRIEQTVPEGTLFAPWKINTLEIRCQVTEVPAGVGMDEEGQKDAPALIVEYAVLRPAAMENAKAMNPPTDAGPKAQNLESTDGQQEIPDDDIVP